MKKLAIVLALAIVLTVAFFIFRETSPQGDPRLAPYAKAKPKYPVVFTSRSNTASLRAASALGTGFTENGQPQWQANEGRLRVLDPNGNVRELTWQRLLPDGTALVDVISPSVSPDGKVVYFAGRRQNERFRIFRVNINGKDLEQVTGLPDDPGCIRVPPLRTKSDGTEYTDAERRKIDYDDVDPIITQEGHLVFASSRQPDLGGSYLRRATQIWLKLKGELPKPLTASRANDRWPYQYASGMVGFTLWSHVNDVIATDGKTMVKYDEKSGSLTPPADAWAAMQVHLSGERFGLMVKQPEPVWRARPTFDGRVVYMSPATTKPFTPENETPETAPLTIAITETGRIANAPSALAIGSQFPNPNSPRKITAGDTTADGQKWSLATPSPSGPGEIVLAAAPVKDTKAYGLYTLNTETFSADGEAKKTLSLQPLFDDPDLVDAEPVVAYPRLIAPGPIKAAEEEAPRSITLADGTPYTGPLAKMNFNGMFIHEQENAEAPGQITDANKKSAIPPFPKGSIEKIVFYATGRDRFDDPKLPMIAGQLQKLVEAPVNQSIREGMVEVFVPTTEPTILFGIGRDGKLVSVTGAADKAGTRAKFYAIAGDHYSGARPNGYHFCTGCHAGHSHHAVPIVESVK